MFTGERLPDADDDFGVDLERHLAPYRWAAARASGRTVLDVGCGEGYGAALLAASAERVIGTDRSEATRVAAARHRSANLAFREQCDERFDLVACCQVIEHVPDPVGFLRDLAARVAPGGTLVVTMPNRLMSVSENP